MQGANFCASPVMSIPNSPKQVREPTNPIDRSASIPAAKRGWVARPDPSKRLNLVGRQENASVRTLRWGEMASSIPNVSCANVCENQHGEPRWTAAPLDSKRLMKCVQEVIMKARNLTQALAAAYGMHSARHRRRMPSAGLWRMEHDSEIQNLRVESSMSEIGPWAGD